MEYCPRCGKMTAEYFSHTNDYKCFNGECYEADYTFTREDLQKYEEKTSAKCWYTGNTTCEDCGNCTNEASEEPAFELSSNFKTLMENFAEYLESVAEKDVGAAWSGNSTGRRYIVDGEAMSRFLNNVKALFEEASQEIDTENVVIPYKSEKTYKIKGIYSEYEAETED